MIHSISLFPRHNESIADLLICFTITKSSKSLRCVKFTNRIMSVEKCVSEYIVTVWDVMFSDGKANLNFPLDAKCIGPNCHRTHKHSTHHKRPETKNQFNQMAMFRHAFTTLLICVYTFVKILPRRKTKNPSLLRFSIWLYPEIDAFH